MKNDSRSLEPHQEHKSRSLDMPRQRTVEPASTIERAAERLDWTIAFGIRYNTPGGLAEAANRQLRSDPQRVARVPGLRFSLARGPRALLGLCVVSVLAATAAAAGIFLLVQPAGEKATGQDALATEAPAKASETPSLVRGLPMMPPAGATAPGAALAGPAPTAAPSEGKAPLALEAPSSPSGGAELSLPTVPATKRMEPTTPFAAPAPRNQGTVPIFSAAEMAGLLARGDWLFATGEVASARLLYERAADAGEARAALRLGETFDPFYLDRAHLHPSQGDPAMAAFWYRRARDLGATGIVHRLERLEAKEERN